MSGASNVTFKLNVDATGAKQGAGAARDALKETGAAANTAAGAVDGTTKSLKDLERQADSTSEAGRRLGIGFGAAFTAATAAYLGLTSKAIKSIDDVYVAAQRLGTSTEFLSSINVAAEQNGVGVGRLSTALNLFSTNVAKAAGGSRVQVQLFDQMGVSVKNSAGQFKSLEDLLPEIASKFAGYKDGPEKAALANNLFGESGSDLLPLLDDLGDRGFAKVRDAAAEMGLVIDSNTAKAAHRFNDEMTALRLTVDAYFTKVAADVLPNLIQFAKGLSDTASGASDANDKTTILGNGIRSFTTFFIEAYGAVQRFGVGVGETVSEVGIELEKLKAQLTSSDYLGAVVGALTGNGTAVAALKVFDNALDNQFAGKLDAARRAANDSFADIDKTVAARVASITKNVNTMGDALGAVPPKARTGNAPFAELGRQSSSRNSDAADNALQAQIGYADSLAEKVGGPLAEAYQKYSDELDRADALAEKSVIAGNDVNAVIDQQNRAYANATATLGKNITAITLRNEKLADAPNAKLLDDTSKYIESIGKEIDATQARNDAGGELNATQEAELFIKDKLTDSSGKVKAGYEAEADSIRKLSQTLTTLQAQEKIQQTVDQGVDSLIEGVRQGVINGQSAFEALGASAAQVLPKISKDLIDVISKMDGAKDGTADFSKIIDGLGDSLEKELPALGQLLGTIAGGGGQGAQIGSAVGSVIGGIVGSLAFGQTAIGAFVGGLLGGVIGGQGDGGGTPAVYGSSRPGSVGRDGTAAVQTPLGIFAADTDNLADDAYKQFEATVTGFDQQLAKLFDPAQLDKVKTALEGFSGKFSDINSLLTARFAVILGTFDDSIKGFVTGFAADLQGQVQALADVLSLQKLDKAGLLVTDNLTDALTLITEFSQAGERVTDTYQRIVTSTNDYQKALALMGVAFDGSKTQLAEFSQQVSDAVGSTQAADALWQEFFADYYTQAQVTASNITLLQSKTNDSLSKIGLDGTITMDQFRQKFTAALPTLTPDEIANWLQAGVALGELNNAINALVTQGESLVDELYGGGSLSDVDSQISDLQAKQKAYNDSIKQTGNALLQTAQIAKSATDLLLGSLSPLNDQQKLQYALQGLRNGTVSQEQVLTIGRQLYASSQQYNDLFSMVRAIGDHTGALNAGSSRSSNSDKPDPFTSADQERLDQLQARHDELDARQRKSEANDLATTVAQLSTTQKESFQQVADELGFNLSDLAKDLGISNDDLTTYLQNIQAQQTAIPDAVTDGSNNVVRALYDIAGKPVPPGLLNDPTAVQGGADGNPLSSHNFGHSGHARGGSVNVGVPDSLQTTAPIAVNTATMVTVQTTTNQKLDAILAAIREGTGAVRDVVVATRGVGDTLRRGGDARRKNTRVPA